MSKEKVATLAKGFIPIPCSGGVNAEDTIHTG